MTLDSYVLVVRETSTHEGVDVDVIDDDGLVEATGQLSYDDHGLTAERDGAPPDRREEPFTVDASSVEIEFDHDGSTLTFRAIADDEEAARIDIDDADWDLADG